MKTFKDYYKFPLKSMIGCEQLKVLTNDGKMAFDWCVMIENIDRNNFINKINGNIKHGTWFKCQYNSNEGVVYFTTLSNNEPRPLLRIRGWGYLTGTGGLNLPENKAKAIQNEFGKYIVKMLNS